MPENESTQQQPTTETAEQPAGAAAETDWKAEARKWETRAKDHQKRITELEPKARQAEAFEQASKTDAERFQEKVNELSLQATAAERKALVASVALEKGLPASLARRLQGESQADLEADADELIAQFPQTPDGPRRPAPDASQGSSAASRSPEQDAAGWLQSLVRK